MVGALSQEDIFQSHVLCISLLRLRFFLCCAFPLLLAVLKFYHVGIWQFEWTKN